MCAIDYHPGRSGPGNHYIYYDRWRGKSNNETSARVRVKGTSVIPDDLECGWVRPEEHVERTMRDESGDYHPYYGLLHGKFGAWVARANHEGGEASLSRALVLSLAAPATSGDTATVCRFLDDAVVIGRDKSPMTLSNMLANVKGRMNGKR